MWFRGGDGEPVLSFAPEGENLALAVPAAVRDTRFDRFMRCLVLRRGRSSAAGESTSRHDSWILVGKTRLFGTEASSRALGQRTEARREQSVFGRSSDEIERLWRRKQVLMFYRIIRATGRRLFKVLVKLGLFLLLAWAIWKLWRRVSRD